jgi:hypothetical protein
MMKIALGLIAALMLASCSFPPPVIPKAASSGVGHADESYPGPRLD